MSDAGLTPDGIRCEHSTDPAGRTYVCEGCARARIATLEAERDELQAAGERMVTPEAHQATKDRLYGEIHQLRADLAREKAAHEKDLARASEITRGALADLDKARADLARVTGERDAYKRAKAENDERFMTERDAARRDLEEELRRWREWARGVEVTAPREYLSLIADTDTALATHPAPEPKEPTT